MHLEIRSRVSQPLLLIMKSVRPPHLREVHRFRHQTHHTPRLNNNSNNTTSSSNNRHPHLCKDPLQADTAAPQP